MALLPLYYIMQCEEHEEYRTKLKDLNKFRDCFKNIFE